MENVWDDWDIGDKGAIGAIHRLLQSFQLVRQQHL